jgi:hypothetical protein
MPKGSPRKATAKNQHGETSDAERQQRVTKAMALRAGHTTYHGIARELGCSVGQAWKYVQAGFREEARRRSETAPIALALELRRLDMMGAALVRKMLGEVKEIDVPAAQALLRVIERRCALLGLDAPTKVEHSGEVAIDLDEVRRRTGEEWETIIRRSLGAVPVVPSNGNGGT